MANAIWLTVVIPAYDEEQRLGTTLAEVTRYLEARGDDFEVLVVDDGSQDQTAAVVQRFDDRRVRLLALPHNRGKGAALRYGVGASRGDWILLCDADLSTPIEDLELLERHGETSQVILGSRATAESDITRHQPVHRELMGKTFNVILRLLGLVSVRDSQCGFKLLRGDVGRELFAQLTIDRFAYDVELVCLARDRGLRVVEQGVRWANSASSRVHPVRDSLNMLLDVLRLRWRRRFGGRR